MSRNDGGAPDSRGRSLKEENIRLLQQNRQLRKEIRDLVVVGEAVRSIASSLNIEEILRNLLNGIRGTLSMETVVLSLINAERGVEVVKLAVADSDLELKGNEWSIPVGGDGTSPDPDSRMSPLLVNSDSPDHPEFVRRLFNGPFVKAPIVVKRQIIGTIMAYRSQGGITSRDLKLLRIFAEYAAVAIENGRLYYDVIKSEEELKQTQTQLVEAERMAVIGQMAVSINHEINNPLSNISLIAQTVLGDPEGRRSELEPLLREIEANVQRIRRVARKISHLKNAASTEYLPDQLMIKLS